MVSVLIIHERSDLAGALGTALHRSGNTALHCASLDDGLAQLSRGPVDLVLCDVSSRAAAIPAAVRRAAPRAAVLGVLDEAQAPDPGALAALSNATVLRPPFAPTQLAETARAAVAGRGGFVGSVSGVPLLELLQMFNLARRSATLVLDGVASGRVVFERGEVVHAETGEARGVEAFVALLNAPGGRFRTVAGGAVERTITVPFDNLMMTALRGADDGAGARGDASSDDDDFGGFDDFRSWAPSALDEGAPEFTLPPPAALPCCDPLPDEPEPLLAARWREARATLHPPAGVCLALAVRGAARPVCVLEGSSHAHGPVREAIEALTARIAALACTGPHGVFECHFGDVAAAVLWHRGTGEALLVGGDARGGVGPFRVYVAALAQRVLEPVATPDEARA